MTLQNELWLFCKLQSLLHSCSGQLTVDIPIFALQQIPIGGSQVPVEESIYKGVDKGVCITQPQKSPLDPERDATARPSADKGSSSGKYKKGKPAHSKGPDNNPKGSSSFLLPFEDGNVLSFVPKQPRKIRAFFGLLLLLDHAVCGNDPVVFFRPWEAGKLVFGSALLGCPEDPIVHEEHH